MIHQENTPDLFPAPRTASLDAPTPAPVHEMRLTHEGPSAAADPIGARLRAARMAQGLALAECAERLHLPIKVLERLEAGDFGAPDHFVFLRGPLTSYAKLLDLPPDTCLQALRTAAPPSQPALTSVARVSHSRWLLQRYGTATTYIVLTAFIAVPLVLLGLRGGLDRPPARIVSLDQTPPASTASGHAASAPDAAPFRASMAPFAAMGLVATGDATGGTVAATPTPVPAAAIDQHTLALTASGDCWFEITGADGGSVDSGLLHAGDTRTWHASGELHVTLGNADAVRATRDGQSFSLDAFKRANVARFDVFGPAAGGATD